MFGLHEMLEELIYLVCGFGKHFILDSLSDLFKLNAFYAFAVVAKSESFYPLYG
jgi:hypothetical protein